MEFLNGQCWPEHEFFDLPEEIDYDILPEFNLSRIQIGARWFVGELDKKDLVPWGPISFGSREKAIEKAESKRSKGSKWKLWLATVLIMDFAHREDPENKFSWISLPDYFESIFWLSNVSFAEGALSNGRDVLPLKDAPFNSVESFIERTNNLTANYMKLTPFEDRKDFFLPEEMPFYPIVCDSKSEGSRYVLSWVPAIESVFARDYFFDNEINTNHLLNRFYEAKTP